MSRHVHQYMVKWIRQVKLANSLRKDHNNIKYLGLLEM